MKSFPSRVAKLFKENLKSVSATTLSAFFGKKSYPLFGLATGVTSWKKDKEILYPSTTYQHKPPETLHPSIFWKFRELVEEIPEEGRFVVENGYATFRGEVLLKNGRLMKTFLCPHEGLPLKKLELFKLSWSRFHPKIYETKEPVAIVTAGWQDAFFHWMYEVLPRIGLTKNRETTFFIAENQHFQKQSLELLGIKKVINANEYQAVRTAHMTVTSTPNAPCPRSIAFLRNEILPKIEKPKKKRRLYISRNDAARRRILNEGLLMDLLSKHGFERILFAHLPFKEQAEIFRSAEMIVAPHGAALSLAVFCDPGTPILEIFSPAYVNTCYWRLANFAKLPYYYLMGEGKTYPDNFDPHLDPDIIVDVKKVEGSLKLIGIYTISNK